MRITAQDGKEYITYGLEQHTKTIKCNNPKDKRKNVTLGVYKDAVRALDVFDEIRTASKYGKLCDAGGIVDCLDDLRHIDNLILIVSKK